jgi:5-methyltetrahydrofolate--homocysteine methyltransferase
MSNRFLNLLAQARATNTPIMVDGAMGTQLFAAGLMFGDPPEMWNYLPDKRDKVRNVYRSYLEAGSQIILTNTFGGTPFRLKMHNLQDRTYELNKLGVEMAREEADKIGPDRVVAGSIGPSGELFEPMGALTYESARDGFARQAEGIAAGGADVFWVETMSDLQEVRAAIAGARLVAPHLPVVATMTFDTKGFTMMGVSPAQAVQALKQLDVAAMGANCGNGPDELEASIFAMHLEDPNVMLVAKGNAGMPKLIDGKAVYDATPEHMLEHARRFRALGATIIGACCGSSPNHIKKMSEALHDMPPLDPSTVHLTVAMAERKTSSRERRQRA